MELGCSPSGFFSNVNLAHVRGASIVETGGSTMDCSSGMMVGGYLTLMGKLLDSKARVMERAESTEIGPGKEVAALGKSIFKAKHLFLYIYKPSKHCCCYQ